MADMNNENNFSNNGFSNPPSGNGGSGAPNQGQNPQFGPQQQNPQFGNQPNAPQQNTNLQNSGGAPQNNPYQQQPRYNQQPTPNNQPNQPQNPNPQQPTQSPQQAPQGASAGIDRKKTLSEEDKERLSDFNTGNDEIKKQRKRKKKPQITENARSLTKVRRLYSARIAHRIYPEQMQEINRLRALAEEGGKKGAALIGRAAKKTRNLVVSILIVLAILAVVGTGTLVTVLMLNKDTGSTPTGTIDFTENTNIQQTITDYRMGTEIDAPIGIVNLTNRELYFLFYVTLGAPTDAPLTEGLDYNDLEIEFLGVNPENWIAGEQNGIIYYETGAKTPMYVNESTTNNQIQIITGYKIKVKEGADESVWIGKSVTLTFNIIGCETRDEINSEKSKIGVTVSA